MLDKVWYSVTVLHTNEMRPDMTTKNESATPVAARWCHGTRADGEPRIMLVEPGGFVQIAESIDSQHGFAFVLRLTAENTFSEDALVRALLASANVDCPDFDCGHPYSAHNMAGCRDCPGGANGVCDLTHNDLLDALLSSSEAVR